MPLTRFKSVRARLLASMFLILMPVASLSVMLASTTYRSLMEGIETSNLQITSVYAARAQAWFLGAARALLSTAAIIDATEGTAANCDEGLQSVIAANDGYVAMRMRFMGGRLCEESAGGEISAEKLNAIARDQARRSHAERWPTKIQAEGRFDAVRVDGAYYLLVDVFGTDANGGKWRASLLASPTLLERALRLDPMDRGVTFAIMKSGDGLIAARGASVADSSWLPTQEKTSVRSVSWRGASRAGFTASYGAQKIADSDLYVLARFDNRASQAAWRQFLILSATPLLTMAILLYAYARIIQKDVLRWINAIEAAARSQMLHPARATPALVDSKMPSELQSVSKVLNAMMADASRREDALRRLLEVNRDLMRELHHRVKNSLQIIQSYLALFRREQTAKDARRLAETEARVQVLATAYRLALTEGGMHLVPVKKFTAEIIDNVACFARESHQWIGASLEWDGAMIIDRIIPYGLLLVEILIAGIEAEGSTNVMVTLRAVDDDRFALSVVADAGAPANHPSEKIMSGLAAQLGAHRERSDDGRAVTLTFSP
jgi:two-component sensor histidine kinase